MTTVNLPDYPKGTEFEEFISAYLQCSGRFIERNLHERAPDDVCELDITLTDQKSENATTMIVEVKSGGWKLHDLFTLRGKMHYLGVPEAAFVTLGLPDKPDLLQGVAEKLGIHLACVETHEQAEAALAPHLGDVKCGDADIEIWRYSYWMERSLVEELRRLRKSSDRVGPTVVWDYYQVLQTNLFQQDMLRRTVGLYRLFMEQPHLAARWSQEMSGGDWTGDHHKVRSDVFSEVYYDHPDCVHELNLVTYVEQKMRLAILKNLVDYELYRRSHGEDAVNNLLMTVGEHELHFVDLLPASFRDALAVLSGRDHFHRYAVLWQWFLWVFGGFILTDYEAQEYEHLGRVAGMPAACVPEALEAFDILFPAAGGWFRDLRPYSNVRLLQLSPTPFFGIGANYRRSLYIDDAPLATLDVKGPYTATNLSRWNNCAVTYLSQAT